MPIFKCDSAKATPKKGIAYIIDPKKAMFVDSQNLFEDEDYAKQFENTARRFGKCGDFEDRKYYHVKLSCARKDNVDPELHHDYAMRIARELFPDEQCVIATHTDTKTVHSHIIFNAVNPITGRKFHATDDEYGAMKDRANEIGKEYGFTETDWRKKAKNSRKSEEQHIMIKGGTSWKEELREVIEEAKRNTKSKAEFKRYLEECYDVKITRDGKDFSYLHPKKQKPIRGAKLGENYTKTGVLNYVYGKQKDGNGTFADSGSRGGFSGQSGRTTTYEGHGNRFSQGKERGLGTCLSDLDRAMQELCSGAEYASRGTDAASEERKIERERDRLRSEEAQRINAEPVEEPSGEDVGESGDENRGGKGAVNSNTRNSRYSNGKGD